MWATCKLSCGHEKTLRVKIVLQNKFHTKGGIVIPNIDFITTLLNVKSTDIKECNIRTLDNVVEYELTLARKMTFCPYCGGQLISHGYKLKVINHPSLREFDGIVKLHANRYKCKECGKTTIEHDPLSFSGFNSSYVLLRSAMSKLGNLNYTLKMISEELNISRTQLCKYLDSYVVIPHRSLPESIGIDEIYSKVLSKKNNSYICVLVDNNRRCLFEVLQSRSKMSLSLYFSGFSKAECRNVKYVTIDMWQPYKDVVKTYLPNATLAVDPFHVIKHLTDDFNKLRVRLMNACEYGSPAYHLLKKWHWLLEEDHVELDNHPRYNKVFKRKLNHRDLYNMIIDTFPELSDAYILKERYRRFNLECDYEDASLEYYDLFQAFAKSGIPEYREFVTLLKDWEEEILNSFKRPYQDRRLSNALTENINGKIRKYLTVSNGLVNFPRFRKRALLALSRDIDFALHDNLMSESYARPKRGPYKKKQE